MITIEPEDDSPSPEATYLTDGLQQTVQILPTDGTTGTSLPAAIPAQIVLPPGGISQYVSQAQLRYAVATSIPSTKVTSSSNLQSGTVVMSPADVGGVRSVVLPSGALQSVQYVTATPSPTYKPGPASSKIKQPPSGPIYYINPTPAGTLAQPLGSLQAITNQVPLYVDPASNNRPMPTVNQSASNILLANQNAGTSRRKRKQDFTSLPLGVQDENHLKISNVTSLNTNYSNVATTVPTQVFIPESTEPAAYPPPVTSTGQIVYINNCTPGQTAYVTNTSQLPKVAPTKPKPAVTALQSNQTIFGLMQAKSEMGPGIVPKMTRTFFCNFCKVKTHDQPTFLEHITFHLFFCGSCEFQAFSRADVVRHILTDHDGTITDLLSLSALHLDNATVRAADHGKQKKSNVLMGSELVIIDQNAKSDGKGISQSTLLKVQEGIKSSQNQKPQSQPGTSSMLETVTAAQAAPCVQNPPNVQKPPSVPVPPSVQMPQIVSNPPIIQMPQQISNPPTVSQNRPIIPKYSNSMTPAQMPTPAYITDSSIPRVAELVLATDISTSSKTPATVTSTTGTSSILAHPQGSLPTQIYKNGKYCCMFCIFSSKTAGAVWSHQEDKHDNLLADDKQVLFWIQCPYCCYSTSQATDMNIHFNKTHTLMKKKVLCAVRQSLGSTSLLMYFCPKCALIEKDMGEMMKHTLASHGSEDFLWRFLDMDRVQLLMEIKKVVEQSSDNIKKQNETEPGRALNSSETAVTEALEKQIQDQQTKDESASQDSMGKNVTEEVLTATEKNMTLSPTSGRFITNSEAQASDSIVDVIDTTENGGDSFIEPAVIEPAVIEPDVIEPDVIEPDVTSITINPVKVIPEVTTAAQPEPSITLPSKVEVQFLDYIPDDVKVTPAFHYTYDNINQTAVCKLCPWKTTGRNARSHIRDHVLNHLGCKVWGCAYCDTMKTNSRIDIIKHVLSHHKGMPFKIVRRKPYSYRYYRTHQSQFNSRQKSRKLKIANKLVKRKMFSCPICGRKDIRYKVISEHVQHVHPEKMNEMSIIEHFAKPVNWKIQVMSMIAGKVKPVVCMVHLDDMEKYKHLKYLKNQVRYAPGLGEPFQNLARVIKEEPVDAEDEVAMQIKAEGIGTKQEGKNTEGKANAETKGIRTVGGKVHSGEESKKEGKDNDTKTYKVTGNQSKTHKTNGDDDEECKIKESSREKSDSREMPILSDTDKDNRSASPGRAAQASFYSKEYKYMNIKCTHCDFHGRKEQDVKVHIVESHPGKRVIAQELRTSKHVGRYKGKDMFIYLCPYSSCTYFTYRSEVFELHETKNPSHVPDVKKSETDSSVHEETRFREGRKKRVIFQCTPHHNKRTKRYDYSAAAELNSDWSWKSEFSVNIATVNADPTYKQVKSKNAEQVQELIYVEEEEVPKDVDNINATENEDRIPCKGSQNIRIENFLTRSQIDIVMKRRQSPRQPSQSLNAKLKMVGSAEVSAPLADEVSPANKNIAETGDESTSTYMCVYCPAGAASIPRIRDHLSSMHTTNIPVAVDLQDKVKVYVCPRCFVATSHSGFLREHLEQDHPGIAFPFDINRLMQVSDAKKKAVSARGNAFKYYQDAVKRAKGQGGRPYYPGSRLPSVGMIQWRYHCYVCGYKTNDVYESQKHMRQTHATSRQEVKDMIKAYHKQKSRLHFCPYARCNFASYDALMYEEHECWEEDDGFMTCARCNFATDDMTTIEMHVYTAHKMELIRGPHRPRNCDPNSKDTAPHYPGSITDMFDEPTDISPSGEHMESEPQVYIDRDEGEFPTMYSEENTGEKYEEGKAKQTESSSSTIIADEVADISEVTEAGIEKQ